MKFESHRIHPVCRFGYYYSAMSMNVFFVFFHSSSCVRIVSSTRAGMGKTLFVNRMADKLRQLKMQGTVLVTIPIHGPQVTTDSVMQYLVNHQDSSYCTILHFDISPSV